MVAQTIDPAVVRPVLSAKRCFDPMFFVPGDPGLLALYLARPVPPDSLAHSPKNWPKSTGSGCDDE
jgi:hypothetical protein